VIFLCCTSAAAGFGSLGWASNTGLSTLGKTCALGLLIDGMISLFLLPKAWDIFLPRRAAPRSTGVIKSGCGSSWERGRPGR
jgi:predicted RND superfamily exporter protein